jgi:ADP-ribose pyrophosphatase YjhB (NUDIX family)
MLRHVDDDGQERYLLTHRSEDTHHGDTYSIPGGARNLDETPEEAADRESHEELEGVPRYRVTSTATADHGGWAYHTVHADADEATELSPQTWETESAARFTPEEIDDLPLHPDFRIYWESLQA